MTFFCPFIIEALIRGFNVYNKTIYRFFAIFCVLFAW